MQEFSSVIASSYDAESLAPMLTAKTSEGWSVVSIVAAGTNIVAYLAREDGASVTNDDRATGATRTPESDSAATDPATGEPAGWGSVSDSSSQQDGPTLLEDASGSGLGAVAGGVGAAPGAAAVGGAAIDDDGSTPGESSEATVGAAEHAGAIPSDSVAETNDGSSTLSDSTDVGAMSQSGSDTGAGLADSIGDATSGAVGTGQEASGDTSGATTGDQAVAGAAAGSGVPAGWYADPSGRYELRYWDGNAWTEHTSRAGQQYTDPPVA